MNKSARILSFLRDHREDYISGEEISEKIDVSRAAVWKEIQALRSLGYEIGALPHQGYRLIRIPDKLFSDEIAHELGTSILGNRIFSYEDLDSTNDTVFKLGQDGCGEGAVVFAEHQKKGRGRMGRTWVAPKGKSVLFSYLLRPRLSPSQIARVTLVTGVSLVRAIREITGKPVGVKWPNDVYYQDKKVGGILTEMSAEADKINFVVVGVGINVNSKSADLPPRSLSLCQIAGHEISRVHFSQLLLREIERDYLRFKDGLFDEIAREWEEYSVTTGHRVVAALLDRSIEGQATGIDADGALWIRKDNGIQERILSGDVQQLRS